MTDRQQTATDDTRGSESEGSEEGRGKGRRMGDGIRQGIGVLSAFKDALEETIQEARDRGDLSTDRAKEVMKEALGRAQEAAGEARNRLDFAPQVDVDTLRDAVDSMRRRLADLEEQVFGASRDESTGPSDESTGRGEPGA